MSSIRVTMELPYNELWQVVEQLPLPDLEKFARQTTSLLARRRTPVLPRQESALLLKINQSTLPADQQERCDALVVKRQAETLTASEHQELITLTDQLGELNGQRLDSLTQLANVRQVPLTVLMDELGVRETAVV